MDIAGCWYIGKEFGLVGVHLGWNPNHMLSFRKFWYSYFPKPIVNSRVGNDNICKKTELYSSKSCLADVTHPGWIQHQRTTHRPSSEYLHQWSAVWRSGSAIPPTTDDGFSHAMGEQRAPSSHHPSLFIAPHGQHFWSSISISISAPTSSVFCNILQIIWVPPPQ